MTSAPAGILVVTVDRLPAWILPAYGATWVAMPGLDALAGRGLVLDRLIACGDDPRRAASDLVGDTGQGLLAAAAAGGWPVTVVTDDESLLPEGLAARATVRHLAASVKADVEDDEEATNLARLFAVAAEVVKTGGQRLVWCHAGSLGVAWDAPGEFREAYVDPDDPAPPAGAGVPAVDIDADTDPDLVVGIRQAFAGQLTLLDHCLGRLLDALPVDGDVGWTVVVAGLRGLPLGLHRRVGTAPLAPYGELVHVPAIIADAHGRMAAQRYGGLSLHADLGVTLVELVSGVPGAVDPSRPMQGRSLVGLLESWSALERDRVIVTGSAGVAVVTPAWQFVRAAPCGAGGPAPGRLFAKPDDYFEVCDVADRCPAVAEELQKIAEAVTAGDQERAWMEPLSAAARGTT
jgi:arylsulfatase A-like enzyme